MSSLPAAPDETRSFAADVRHFLLHRPAVSTLVATESESIRADYERRIAQRVGIDVSGYSILNVHRIGIDAPVRYVFEEISRWDGGSPCWPDHVATMEEIDGERGRLRVVLLGRAPLTRWLRRGFGPGPGTLFIMNAVENRQVPISADFDNARYLLWECSGGYPIGVFSIYVRSAIPERDEVEQTHVFFAVGFNPYGRSFLAGIHPVRSTWEAIHNRVTSNVLNRFKRLCEAGFRDLQDGTVGAPAQSDDQRQERDAGDP